MNSRRIQFYFGGVLTVMLVMGILWGIRGKNRNETMVSAVSLAEQSEKKYRVALTFDDGPHPVYTKMLLEGLKKRNVKASFFLVGKNIVGNEKLVLQMHKDGHLIGNHTYDHVQLSKISDAKACEQIYKTSNLIYEITGIYTSFVRPPFGEWKKELDCRVTMLPVMWNVDPVDWNTKDTNAIVRRVESVVEDEDIILLHDEYDSSVQAAFRIIDDLRKKDVSFVTVDELLLK